MKVLLTLILVTASAFASAADSARRDMEEVFDRNKGGIYALYSKALRDNPKLAGKIVFDIDIAKTGDVTACRVRSSNLGSPDLERKLCDRISQMKFKPAESASTLTKPLDFYPAT